MNIAGWKKKRSWQVKPEVFVRKEEMYIYKQIHIHSKGDMNTNCFAVASMKSAFHRLNFTARLFLWKVYNKLRFNAAWQTHNQRSCPCLNPFKIFIKMKKNVQQQDGEIQEILQPDIKRKKDRSINQKVPDGINVHFFQEKKAFFKHNIYVVHYNWLHWYICNGTKTSHWSYIFWIMWMPSDYYLLNKRSSWLLLASLYSNTTVCNETTVVSAQARNSITRLANEILWGSKLHVRKPPNQ